VLKDEGIRRGTPMEKMAQLKPAFKEDGVIHAGNSSQISDGSAALLFMFAEKAKSLKINPIAKVHTATLAGTAHVYTSAAFSTLIRVASSSVLASVKHAAVSQAVCTIGSAIPSATTAT
jgi:acetyl-CoA acetyltransferase